MWARCASSKAASAQSVFLVAPVALLARKLWGAALAWLVIVGAFVAAAASAGLIAPWVAVAAVLVIHLVLAIDVAEMERRRLARHGWSMVALDRSAGARCRQAVTIDHAMTVAIVDYGSGNLHSAQKAFERAARERGLG